MDQSTFISAAMKLFHITNLNTHLLDTNGEFVFHHGEISIPPFMPGTGKDDIVYFQEQMKPHHNQLRSYTNEWGLHYLGYTVSMDHDFAVIVGPFMELTPNLYNLARQYRLSNNESEDLRNVCNQIQVLTIGKVNSFSSILQNFEVLIENDTKPIRIEANRSDNSYKTKNNVARLNEDAEIVKTRYPRKINEVISSQISALFFASPLAVLLKSHFLLTFSGSIIHSVVNYTYAIYNASDRSPNIIAARKKSDWDSLHYFQIKSVVRQHL